jgi:CRP-like cAMP-binding protein
MNSQYQKNRQRNLLLAALPEADCRRLSPNLEWVTLKLGQVLHESGIGLKHVYFPTDSIISLLYVMENGESAEIAIVGNEGMVGICLFTGGDTTTSRAVVQSSGHAFRLKQSHLTEEFERCGPLQRLLLRYVQVLFTQTSQTAVCNQHHSVQQQLCRWLLLSIDCLPENKLVMTQSLIADTLGVRRESVTEAASKLQAAGVLSYVRGKITVIDRPLLERTCCECYAVVRKETDRLLLNVVAR